VFGLMERV